MIGPLAVAAAICAVGLALTTTALAQGPATTQPFDVRLWSGEAPGNEGRADQQRTETTSGRELVFNTHHPSMRVFLPPAETATGAAMIVCPGGGYNVLETEKEGALLAQKLNDIDVAAFVLRYRLRRYDVPGDDPAGRALLDAQRAIRTVRAHAAEWGIDPNRVGIGGFSAGGHLSANSSTHHSPGDPAAQDAVDRLSSRPDFAVLVYPAVAEFDQSVNKDTPPAFLLHAANDEVVGPDESIRYFQALTRNGVPAEVHILQAGGHGFGLGNEPPARPWFHLLHQWMSQRGLLVRSGASKPAL
jgi:acetyl esterase/lipase